MFDLNQIPWDAYCKLLSTHKSYLKEFTPTNYIDDLRTGNANCLVYWYPDYSLTLFEMASNGMNYKQFFDDLNPKNYWLFVDLFQDTVKKLDTLKDKKFNNTILDEIRIKNGKLK